MAKPETLTRPPYPGTDRIPAGSNGVSARENDAALQDDLGPEKIKTMRIAAALGIVLYASFAILDIWAIPGSLYQVWAIRACVVALLALVFASTYHPVFVRRYTLIAALLYLVLGGAIDAMIYLAAADELARTIYYSGLILVVFALYTWTYLPTAVSLAVGLALVLSYLYIAIAVHHMGTPEEWPILLANSFFFVSASVIGFVGGQVRDRFAQENHRLRNALERELEETIAARRASELEYVRRLQDSEAIKTAIIETAPVSLVTLDSSGQIIALNPHAERCFGYRREQVLGRRFQDLLIHPADLTAAAGDREPEAIGWPAGFASGPVETIGTRADGLQFPAEVALAQTQLGGTEIYAAFIVDLTQKREAEEEIRRQREALYQREKLAAMGSLLAGVAHELNNPLSVVVGRSLMLEEDLLHADSEPMNAGQLKQTVERIRQAAERCARIVRTFLAMARQQRSERREVDLNQIIQSSLDMLSYPLRTSGVELDLVLDRQLPLFPADEDQLHQVFMNLFVNAQQAMANQAGARRLTVTSLWKRQEQSLMITVGDTGPGIAREHRNRIFEPYFTTKPQGQGTGVGLAVCLGIVESHGGTLSFDCPDSGGTVFRITIPIAMHSAADYPATAPATDATVTTAVPLPHVLVVDDEPEIADMLRDMLRPIAAGVETASNGREALEELERGHFDLVLTDFRMPVLGGQELYRKIAQQWPHLENRVIFLTGDTLSPDARQFLDTAGPRVIEKPFHANEVRQRVLECLEHSTLPR